VTWWLVRNVGVEAKDAAWYYPEPKSGKAEKLKDCVAFCEFCKWLMGVFGADLGGW
jgi:uncharacterized protein (DUF427 family)